MLLLRFLFLISIPLWLPGTVEAAPPTTAVRFTIVKPPDSAVGTPVTVTIEARKTTNEIDTSYQNDVTLLTSGSATGGGLVNIVNGTGSREINDSIAETVTLSLSDTESTGLDVSSTQEVVFASVGGGAVWNQIKFWFRDDDGGEMEATGFGSQNIGHNINVTDGLAGSIFRLRLQIKVTDADGTISPRLEFKEGVDCSAGSWTALSSENNNFSLHPSSHFDDGASTTQQLTAGPNFISGKIFDATNPGPSITLFQNQSTEYEWSLKTSGDISLRTTYAFRITDNGTALNNYEQCPLLTVELPPGGGGGVRTKIVRLAGQAYPESKIEILMKSSEDALYTPTPEIPWNVNRNGAFSASYDRLVGGHYFFALRAEDKDGRKTGIWPFLVSLGDELVAENLLVPPTIGFVRATVRKGDFLTVVGYAAPESTIEAEIDGWSVKEKEKADIDGFYKMPFPTSDLPFGTHTIHVRQTDTNGKASDFSVRRTFVVSKLFFPQTDLNGDDTINIRDWSTFLFLFNSKDTNQKKQIDFNDDGAIDISDFGIFIKTIEL